MKIIGIDLGTTNTYVYTAVADSTQSGPDWLHEEPHPVIIPAIGDDSGSIATVVLYEDDKAIAIGNIAESEYNANISRQKRRRLATQFKPEIAQGDTAAMTWMTDFLRLLKENMPQGLLDADTTLYAGMPSLAREDFSINLGQCFFDAGWPKPVFARESDAALASCLQAGVLDIEDMERQCLILDYGGGTCDYTLVEGLTALRNGGDPLYGGRLFDDLIYQAFCNEDATFAKYVAHSPAAWQIHWIECREQKEKFSDLLNSHANADNPGFTLHASWLAANGQMRDSFIPGYTRERFTSAAENYSPSEGMLKMLACYEGRGGLSREARDLLEGRKQGLISWLRVILDTAADRRELAKIVLTGGSSRWFFVKKICKRLYPGAICVESARGFEDIAYGLALFPVLLASRQKVAALLKDKLPEFIKKSVERAREIVGAQTESVASMCSERIALRDIMPVLEEAQKHAMTIGDLEKKWEENIRSDSGLLEIVRQKSEATRMRIQEELRVSFNFWLRANGVLLVPRFEFPAQAIGEEFFDNLSARFSELDLFKLLRVGLLAILPIIAGAAAAHALAPLGEPVSIMAGISLTGGAAWLAAKTAPGFLEKRKLPPFLLTEKIRAKIVNQNRQSLEKELSREFAAAQKGLVQEVDRRLRDALKAMLGRLTILNQVKTR